MNRVSGEKDATDEPQFCKCLGSAVATLAPAAEWWPHAKGSNALR